jgi:hypothetical protein
VTSVRLYIFDAEVFINPNIALALALCYSGYYFMRLRSHDRFIYYTIMLPDQLNTCSTNQLQ